MILFIDDQALLTKTLREYITDIGQYEVKHAMDWGEALSYIDKYKSEIHLVLLDIMMPREINGPIHDKFGIATGLRLGKKIKEILPEIPIVGITVRNDIAKNDKEDAGILKIFLKPINPEELLITIKKLYHN